MSTIQPRHLTLSDGLVTYGGDGWFYLECTYANPPSWANRTVTLALRPEEITLLLKELRDAAILARSKPMET